MTKPEIEKLNTEMRELRDLIIRMDEKVKNVYEELKKGNEKFNDHEERLRNIEEFKTEIRTKIVVYSAAVSFVASAIVAMLIKLF